MNESIRQLTQEVAEQNESVPHFRTTDDPVNTVRMLVEEVSELKEELDEAFLTDDLTEIVSEIGDVLFLTLKLCDSLGVNADQAIEMKKQRNMRKYGVHTDKDLAKKEWDMIGGDAWFFKYYLDSLAEVEDI